MTGAFATQTMTMMPLKLVERNMSNERHKQVTEGLQRKNPAVYHMNHRNMLFEILKSVPWNHLRDIV